jgi:hypothetical protein
MTNIVSSKSKKKAQMSEIYSENNNSMLVDVLELTWKIYNMLQKLLIKTPNEKMHVVKIIK